MRTRATALASASALLIAALVSFASPAPAAAWYAGWCKQGEGLSVVVDYGGIDDDTIPTEGWDVRCLVGGVIDAGSQAARIAALEAVGFTVDAPSGGYVEAINGVAEYDHGTSWWMFSGTEIPGAWDIADYDLVADGPNIDVALGARYVVDVGDGTPRPTPQFGLPAAPGPEPELSGATPQIDGTARVGKRLSATPGAWTAGATLTYQWTRSGRPISGATNRRYTLVPTDRGRPVAVTVTGTKDGFAPTSRTANSVTVKAGTLKTAKPRIVGTARQGKRLKATPGAWGPGPVTLRYQWLRNGKKIAKATMRSYRLVAKDRGKRISVKVTGTKVGYAPARTTSKTTIVVRR